MKNQNRIKKHLAQPEVIEYIKGFLEVNDVLSRTMLADTLCEKYNFYDMLGNQQRSSCYRALRELEKQGHFTLPKSRTFKGGIKKARRLGKPVPEAEGVPKQVHAIGQLELLLVDCDFHMMLWNEMMIVEHPQGKRPLVGRQLRYLIKSEFGYLGALGFAAPALQLRDRDAWIGWDIETRRNHLDKIVCMNRFLIRNKVHCKNLASRVLSLCVKRMPDDFEWRYGYRPLLMESFVDTSCFSGACYQAANWQHVGKTQGRGRQDRSRKYTETVKDIYMYPLVKDFRQKLGLSRDKGKGSLSLEDGVVSENWAAMEFQNAPLGDKRLTDRVIEIAQIKGDNPGSSWLSAIHGDRAAAKGYYRLIEKPEDSAVTMSNLLLPHRERTIQRMQSQNTVLCIHDTTEFDFSTLTVCPGLGVIGKNQTKTESRGLRLHSTFVTTTTGLPLGILRANCDAPKLKPEHKGKDRRFIPLEEKDSLRWVEGLQDCQAVSASLPGTSLVCVMDREGDFFDLIDMWRQNPTVEVLIRAYHNRRLEQGGLLFDYVSSQPVLTNLQIDVSYRSARRKKGKRAFRPKRKARTAEVSVQYVNLDIPSPNQGLSRHKEPINLNIIHVFEKNPPSDVEEPLEWFLITTVQCNSPEDVEKCLLWYCLRWRIEDWHRVMKSGCNVEKATHKTAERLKRFISINLVVAWRIMLMTLLGRKTPKLPPEVFFTDIELQVLQRYAKKKTMNRQRPSVKQSI
ncbi:IS4 family transposase [candidate division CSSED10-310 bacterium]|uniref:IS4 family transposase n=1 Tax=candidate division CSSED10-310 bacterium TaxID=2855610 RepID=A0ABV6YW00_UNCC1